jgi:hypothetical protein
MLSVLQHIEPKEGIINDSSLFSEWYEDYGNRRLCKERDFKLLWERKGKVKKWIILIISKKLGESLVRTEMFNGLMRTLVKLYCICNSLSVSSNLE